MRRFLVAVAVAGSAVAVALTGSPASASPASTSTSGNTAITAARDDKPCNGAFFHREFQQEVRYCPDWSPSGSIPVHLSTSKGSEVVGHINPNGADWYYCQQQGERYTLGRYVNNWYAYTMADNGKVGWVNETYFQGGGNNGKDGGLPGCRGI